ncbi:hypothetical protein E1181_25625 [Saccharopolyspora terrae]|uniref:Uncharacterized protein n=1 Tax=Saccharopolyspora terrae TaxID=2530384 RepID=A0A4R4VCM4_9PSEU|nr:hypothetical protein [Saccharopolyspora terrae]TDD01287.1 hypothetical protein E1181_25625 [Saccharopolyspora terrae]
MFGSSKKRKSAQGPFFRQDGSMGGLRRDELACLRHKHSSGEQISDTTVRWTCECGAYQDQIDAARPHEDHEEPTGAFLEQELRGTQGESSPWRSQVTGKPMPQVQQETPGTPGSSVEGSGVSSAAQARAALADANERAGYVRGALAQARMDLEEITAQISTVSGRHDAQSLTEVTGCYQQAAEQLAEINHLLFRATELTKTYGLRLLA